MKEVSEQPSRWRRAEYIIEEYAEYSTIAGVIYIYMKDQTWFGKLYWKIWILLLFVLGTYWSCQVIYKMFGGAGVLVKVSLCDPTYVELQDGRLKSLWLYSCLI